MIKILTNSPPADNGNKFLCEGCHYASIRSGTHSQREMFCSKNYDQWSRITFRVSQCSEYTKESEFKDKAVKSMLSQAWYITSSDEGRGLTLVPPDTAKRRGMIDE